MRKALGVIAILALVTSASAGIDIYLTKASDFEVMTPDAKYETTQQDFSYTDGSYGLTDGTYHALTHCPFVQGPGTTVSYYIWAKMTLEPAAVPNVAKIQLYGLDLRGSAITNGTLSGATDPNNGDTGGVFYRHNGTTKRWDGADALLFKRDFMAAVSASGVLFSQTSTTDNLGWRNGTYEYDALLGAVDVNAGLTAGSLTMGMGELYMAVKEFHKSGNNYTQDQNYDTDPNHANAFYPKLSINGVPVNQLSGPVTVVSWTPEPASLLLIGLGLLLRRR